MKNEILEFIHENNLSPFNTTKTQIKQNDSIYKTLDAKKIHTRMLGKISENFVFSDTSNILNFFSFTNSKEEIKRRQEFFKSIFLNEKFQNNFLKKIKNPKPWWKPDYDAIVVTEDVDTYNELKKRNCPVKLIISESDVGLLESKDVVEIIHCPEYGVLLDSLPQGIFTKKLDEVYLERHLENFSGWFENIKLLNENKVFLELKEKIDVLIPLLSLVEEKNEISLNEDILEDKIFLANEKISEKLKELTLSGDSLFGILSKGVLPENIKKLINEIIEEFEIPREVIDMGIPVKLNNFELNKLLERESKNIYTNSSQKIKEYKNELKNIPIILKEIEKLILYFDFVSGISRFIDEEMKFPEISEVIKLENIKNYLIENPEPISFSLSKDYKCSILTGANSGGKTTLIEHILQINSLVQLGLPVYGNVNFPLFEEIYYFAKNKGSASKGAFETLLTQMSKIKPGNKTLILADEIEAVTEPGVAGKIITATAEYYLEKNCFLIIATHLGYEIEKILPKFARIDGIEAKGLTENFDLIVDHNPVLGRLAHSTPELIVEKMANKEKQNYFIYLNEFLKNN